VRALAVDDDEDVLHWLSMALSLFGIEVTTATSCDQAFARFVEMRPDVVISDVQMPGRSGLELMRQIRALPPARGGLTPAIAISGGAHPDETLAAGFQVCFTKPAVAQTLIDAIRVVIRDAASSATGGPSTS
jgi:CheY-like chemotaxis protein